MIKAIMYHLAAVEEKAIMLTFQKRLLTHINYLGMKLI